MGDRILLVTHLVVGVIMGITLVVSLPIIYKAAAEKRRNRSRTQLLKYRHEGEAAFGVFVVGLGAATFIGIAIAEKSWALFNAAVIPILLGLLVGIVRNHISTKGTVSE